MSYHEADARRLLDDRGYTGQLIKGQNPALLFEKAVRDRITESYYWKEQCFGLNASTLCDRAAELTCVGGTYGLNGKPTPFLCLAFKMIQLVPAKEIILEYLNWRDPRDVDAEVEQAELNGENGVNGVGDWVQAARKAGEFKYLRALAAFYIRLAWEPKDVYETLEPLLADFRKLKRRTRDGYRLTYMDVFVDELLTRDRVCATSLWKLPPRTQLEDEDVLDGPRVSALGSDLDGLLDDAEDGEDREDGDVESVHSG